MIEYRDLHADQAHALADLDRSEFIDGEYTVSDGALVLEAAAIDAASWDAATVATYVDRLTCVLRAGGRAVGAWNGQRLVGFVCLDPAGVGGDAALMLLDLLYVDRAWRGRGIGGALTRQIGAIAGSIGADALYISATPTSATVDAYLRLGAVLIDSPDPVLFAREPDDIHLRLDLAALESRTR